MSLPKRRAPDTGPPRKATVRELFIYYRIASPDADEALAAVRQMQRRLCECHPALSARLLRRIDESSRTPMQTWMEIYSFDDADGVSPALEAAIAREAQTLQRFMRGIRHTEAFAPLSWQHP